MKRSDGTRKNVFDKVYETGLWNSGSEGTEKNPLSGPGSTLENTESTRNSLKEVILKYNIKSIVDAPCGDLTWMKTLFPFFKEHGVSYTGVDIVKSQIDKHRQTFPEHTFLHVDMVLEKVPKADLIFSREMTQHLAAEDNMRIFNNWKMSGSTFVFQTNYESQAVGNFDKNFPDAGFNPNTNLQIEPYNFPAPVEKYVEQKGSLDATAQYLQSIGSVEYLSLYRFSDFSSVSNAAGVSEAQPRQQVPTCRLVYDEHDFIFHNVVFIFAEFISNGFSIISSFECKLVHSFLSAFNTSSMFLIWRMWGNDNNATIHRSRTEAEARSRFEKYTWFGFVHFGSFRKRMRPNEQIEEHFNTCMIHKRRPIVVISIPIPCWTLNLGCMISGGTSTKSHKIQHQILIASCFQFR